MSRANVLTLVPTIAMMPRMDNVINIPAEALRMQYVLSAAGVSQAEFSRRCGFHPGEWARWRKGLIEPRMSTWLKARRVFADITGEKT